MRPIGFSTGALAKGDFRAGIEMQRAFKVDSVEISALRDSELKPLLDSVGGLLLDSFDYVSFHAPSRLAQMSERELVAALADIPSSWPIVIHPDVIREPAPWRFFGDRLCVENMDQRKPAGRTVVEMKKIFEVLPEASFCFDIGHARQVDPTMGVAIGLLEKFRDRLRHIHISEVDPCGRHIPVGPAARRSFRKVARLIPEGCPVIIESMVDRSKIQRELDVVRWVLAHDLHDELTERGFGIRAL